MSDSELLKKLEFGVQNKKANKKLLAKLKKYKPKKLDAIFHEKHDEVFEEIDCLECANCCKTTSPIFRDKDIERLAKHFKIKASKFIDEYLHLDGDQDYVLNQSPCAFLDEDNYCQVYDVRPNACREYPHTDRKNIHQLMGLTLKNTMVCPAVNDIVKKIGKDLQRG